MQKISSLFIVSLLMLCGILTPVHSYAQTNTESETQEASDSSSIENIKKIITDNLNSGMVRGTIDNLMNRKVALIGEVSRVTDETITVTNRLGTRIIEVTNVLSLTKNNTDIEITDIAVENWILVLGKISNDTFSPVFIEVNEKTLRPKEQFVSIGTVTQISANTLTIDPRNSDTEEEISLVKTTTFENSNGDAINKALITEDITVLVTGYLDDGDMQAATIHSLAVIQTDE